ncbi:MAG: hypothetical protein COB04_05355 [Gammaproteobacteria bacterium]|nr:MAG: hypothetical protein COB04_05355 [Gammaproteobacteria bacterium]
MLSDFDAGKDKKVLTAIYDMRYSPATFDFGSFLVIAECLRQANDYSEIMVNILTNEFRAKTNRDIHTPAFEKRWRINNIMEGISRLLPSITGLNISRKPAKDVSGMIFPQDWTAEYKKGLDSPYAPKLIKQLYDLGASPRVFCASEYARSSINSLYSNNYCTLTLRNSRYQLERNTDLAVWYQFYQYVEAAGYQVVVIPDQEDLLSGQLYMKYPWQSFDVAAMDLDLRFALYENSVANFCSSNGPCSLLFYSDCPVYQFDQLKGKQTDEKFWQPFLGFNVGSNYPWSKANQIMTWKPSSLSNLCHYFDLFLSQVD